MPDLRDDLGRLADFVGEPRGLDDLAAARRRRERRRRAEGLVAGIAVVLATALFLVSTFRAESTSSVPGASATPTGGFEVPAVPYLWPENWADATGADALAATEASVAAGDRRRPHGASTRSRSSGGSRRRYWAGQSVRAWPAVGGRDAVVGSLTGVPRRRV